MPERELTHGEIDFRLSALGTDVAGLKHVLYGNGDEGIKDRLMQLENRLHHVTRTLENMDDSAKSVRSDVRRAAFAVVGTLMASFLLFVAAIVWAQISDQRAAQEEIRTVVRQAVQQTLADVKHRDAIP